MTETTIKSSQKYLANIPQEYSEHGFCKVLNVRHEVIHLKHIFTEIFVRKTIDIEPILEELGMSLFQYMYIMTNKMRAVHKISRDYNNDINKIVKDRRINFLPTLELLSGLNNLVVLDFDGVTTDPKFKKLYDVILDRFNTNICSANPTITDEWFVKRDMRKPRHVYSCKGKIAKLKCLIELNKKYDNVFFIDNEEKYLKVAWIFGIKTYLWDGKVVRNYTLNDK